MFNYVIPPVGIFLAIFSFCAMIDPSAGPVAFVFLFTFIIGIRMAMEDTR